MFSVIKRSLRLGIHETALGSDTSFFLSYAFAIGVHQNYLGAEVKTITNIRTAWRPRNDLQHYSLDQESGGHDLLTAGGHHTGPNIRQPIPGSCQATQLGLPHT
ncbi:hypothetical protein VN97_g10467 [Penicillium thymicola]|uniref:Uncharacterized protein n=1 Tax=Penicillium thymicola TaxID=293382 RepID=A0AAI9T8Y2_PENTH|nr:hypothetical protein VN97_g10467 [Penicillium thymicola]